MEDASVFAEQALRCQQLLHEGTTSALTEALGAAHACLNLDKTQVRGYLLLTEALSRLRRHEGAVNWYKKGLQSAIAINALQYSSSAMHF